MQISFFANYETGASFARRCCDSTLTMWGGGHALPLSEWEKARLLAMPYDDANSRCFEEQKECSICLRAFEPEQAVQLLRCGHTFH